ncbi:MAG: hypothetical protein IIC13_03715 [SAR324 cluster bacterium]|nr:hypothetical protein [SAR324 cluster bacterium]
MILYAAGLFRKYGTALKPFKESSALVTDGPFRFSRNPMYLSMVVALTGAAVVLGTVTPLLILPAFAWLITVQVVGFVAGTMLVDRLTRRIGMEKLFEIAVLIAALGGITTGLLPWLGIASITGIIAPMVVFAFAMGIIFPLGTAGAIGPFPHMAGSAAALLGFLQSAAGAAFGVLVGVLHDGSVIPMTSVMGLTTSLSVAVFLMLLWRRPGEDVGTVATEARSDV